MNTVSRIDSADDFSTLVQQAPLVIVTRYRSKWCPFCRTFLRELDTARLDMPRSALLVVVSVDTLRNVKRYRISLSSGLT